MCMQNLRPRRSSFSFTRPSGERRRHQQRADGERFPRHHVRGQGQLLLQGDTSFRADFGEHYLKVFPPGCDSLHCFWSMIRVAGEPFRIPRFLTATATFACNVAAIQEGFNPFL